MSRKSIIFYILNIIIPLELGTLLYCMFRPDAFYIAKLTKVFPFLQRLIVDASNDVPAVYFIRYYVMDILWAYALMMALYFLSEFDFLKPKSALIIALTFACVSEISQLLPVVSMTFDVYDIILQIVGVLVAYLFLFLYYRKKVTICQTGR